MYVFGFEVLCSHSVAVEHCRVQPSHESPQRRIVIDKPKLARDFDKDVRKARSRLGLVMTEDK